MISLTVVIIILFLHFLSDFVFQTDWQAQNKSKLNKALIEHTATYSAVWFIPMVVIFLTHSLDLDLAILKALSFVGITFIFHTTQDYFTSRLNSRLWEQKKVHNFFVSIGLDQFGHYAQLLLTYYLLK